MGLTWKYAAVEDVDKLKVAIIIAKLNGFDQSSDKFMIPYA